jgi:alkylhydroperoxidase/carboxymuconolactone decarboxylase family protein YurZ
MARPRLPQAKAEVAGAAITHPGRFKDRKAAKRTRALGEPYARMPLAQQECWREIAEEMPWLNSSHRRLVRLASIISARLDDEDVGINQLQTLSAILSKLGATPVDETKVNHGDEEDDDPADAFFARSH